jgi:hypothetical protein
MKNTGKVKQIKQSWFGNWACSGILEGCPELLMFHLTDDATIVATTLLEGKERTEEFAIEAFERCFNISIAELISK